MIVDNSEEAVLIVIDQKQQIIPLSTAAFQQAQRSERLLNRELSGSLVMYRSGRVRRIDEIKVHGWRGNSLLRKLFSMWNGDRDTTTCLSDVAATFDQVKEAVLKYLAKDRERVEPFLPASKPLEATVAEIRAATSVAEVFDILEVPEPENCLDVL